jgi:putative PIN family toxin of toxin-antitoxin system
MKSNFFVFDTNILLSALFDDTGVPAKALKKARINGTLLISDEVVTEYLEVFTRKKFDRYVPIPYRLVFIENIISNALPVLIHSQVDICRDPRDNKFLSLAVAAETKCIVTGDNDLLILHPFQNIPILNPLNFINSFK